MSGLVTIWSKMRSLTCVAYQGVGNTSFFRTCFVRTKWITPKKKTILRKWNVAYSKVYLGPFQKSLMNFFRSFIKKQTSDTSSNNEWQRVVQRVTTIGITSYNEWQRVTTSDNEWPFQLVFIFSNKRGTYH